jgi:hypothetical protein
MGRNPEGHNPGWWRKHPDAKRPLTPKQNDSGDSETYKIAMPLSFFPMAIAKKSRKAVRSWWSLFWKKLPEKKNDIVPLMDLSPRQGCAAAFAYTIC